MSELQIHLNHFLKPSAYVWEYEACTPDEMAIVERATAEGGQEGRLRTLIELGKVKHVIAGRDVYDEIVRMVFDGRALLRGGIIVPVEPEVLTSLRRPALLIPVPDDDDSVFYRSFLEEKN